MDWKSKIFSNMINCIIVDDEAHCIASLSQLIKQNSRKLLLLATFTEAETALKYLENNTVDLIFTDIQMIDMSGLAFAEKVAGKAKIIFTTAYKDFAAESYELDALDFLQKPIGSERFKKAIKKMPTASAKATGAFFIKDFHKKIKIDVKEVTFIEGDNGYVKIYQQNKKESILTLGSLNEMEKQLKPYDFYRIHNSHIIHMPYIMSFDANNVELNLGNETKSLPISDGYRSQFLRAMPVL
jgi:two-component system, LytTR family, response regulator